MKLERTADIYNFALRSFAPCHPRVRGRWKLQLVQNSSDTLIIRQRLAFIPGVDKPQGGIGISGD